MQKKRKAQEAFTDQTKPRLSAFAAARAKAANKTASSPDGKAVSTLSGEFLIAEFAGNNLRNGAVSNHNSLPTLLSSFPLSKSQELADVSSSDELEDAADFSDDENYHNAYSTASKAVQPTRLSSISPDKYCIVSDQPDRLTLKLESDQTAAFIGEYDIQVITGIVMVYGAVLRASAKTHRVYAPSTHALPVITAKGGSAEIVIISTGRSMDGLSKLSPLWSRLWHGHVPRDEDVDSASPRSFLMLRTSSDDPLRRAVSPLEIEQDIQVTLNRILNNPTATHPSSVIMVSGPKGSGKSTISRWLVNTFLTASKAVASPTCFWLDLDPGQPEFSTPGQVTLVQVREPILGPPFTHPTTHISSGCRSIRSHTLAANSPKEGISHFLACAFNLRDEYFKMLEDFPGAPLIINCSGWVLGSAVTVMMDLVQQFPLTDVVLMQPMEPDTIASIENTLPTAKVLTITPRAKPHQSRTSAELRNMQTMSYFHSLPPWEAQSIWTNKALSELQPFHVRYNGPDAGISAIMSYGEAVNPDFLASVIDGMVLAVCTVESDEAYGPMKYRPQDTPNEPVLAHDKATTGRIGRTPEGIPYHRANSSGIIDPLDPCFSSFKGLALVRGIDVDKQELQLLTCMSALDLAGLEGNKTVLVRGKFDSPDWAFLEDIYSGTAQKMREQEALGDSKEKTVRPYVAMRDAETGLGGNVWRVRHLPRKMGGGDVGA